MFVPSHFLEITLETSFKLCWQALHLFLSLMRIKLLLGKLAPGMPTDLGNFSPVGVTGARIQTLVYILPSTCIQRPHEGVVWGCLFNVRSVLSLTLCQITK